MRIFPLKNDDSRTAGRRPDPPANTGKIDIHAARLIDQIIGQVIDQIIVPWR